MKLMKAMVLVLPAYVLLSACGAKPDPSSVQNKSAASSVKSGDQTASTTTPSNTVSNPSAPAAPVDVAALEQQKADLEGQKASLLAQQQDVQGQKSAFNNPAAVQGQQFGDFMGDVAAIGVDQAKLDAIIQAAQDMDLDALQKAIEDLIADIQDQVADIQAQIDDLAAQIQAAQA